jgi:hypothetical protein
MLCQIFLPKTIIYKMPSQSIISFLNLFILEYTWKLTANSQSKKHLQAFKNPKSNCK